MSVESLQGVLDSLGKSIDEAVPVDPEAPPARATYARRRSYCSACAKQGHEVEAETLPTGEPTWGCVMHQRRAREARELAQRAAQNKPAIAHGAGDGMPAHLRRKRSTAA